MPTVLTLTNRYDVEENIIDVTGVNLREMVKRAYSLSNAQGMGFLHSGMQALSIDYLKGNYILNATAGIASRKD